MFEASLLDVIDAISRLLWPLLAAIALIVLLPQLRKVIQSRNWTLKAGGMELNVQEASDQIHKQVKDLQEQVSMLKGVTIERAPEERRALPARRPGLARRTARRSILWVDDIPTNNAYQIQSLKEQGWDVDLATTTAQGLSTFDRRPDDFALVITDLGREEGGTYKHNAGLELIQELRKHAGKDRLPILVSTVPETVEARRNELIEDGATDVTSSPTELLALVSTVIEDSDTHDDAVT